MQWVLEYGSLGPVAPRGMVRLTGCVLEERQLYKLAEAMMIVLASPPP